MKKTVPWLTTLFALALLLAGCSSSSGSDDNGISAPELPSASSITMTGATSAPTTEADAQALYTDSLGALSSFIGSNSGASASRLSRGNARATDTKTEPLDATITSPNGGTVTLSGSVTYTSTEPDNTTAFIPNHTYNDIGGYSLNGDVTGTMASVKVTNGGHTYTICGTLKEIESFTMNVDVTTGATQNAAMSYNLDISLGLGIGTAVSVVREDGVGAKFVITYAANYGKDNIAISENSDNMDTAFTEMEDYLAKQTATLTVYDQNNAQIFQSTLSADKEFNAASVF